MINKAGIDYFESEDELDNVTNTTTPICDKDESIIFYDRVGNFRRGKGFLRNKTGHWERKSPNISFIICKNTDILEVIDNKDIRYKLKVSKIPMDGTYHNHLDTRNRCCQLSRICDKKVLTTNVVVSQAIIAGKATQTSTEGGNLYEIAKICSVKDY